MVPSGHRCRYSPTDTANDADSSHQLERDSDEPRCFSRNTTGRIDDQGGQLDALTIEDDH